MGGVARFSFLDICGLPLGAADYMALARRFHTVFITSIPAMSMQVRDIHSHCCLCLCSYIPRRHCWRWQRRRMYMSAVVSGRTILG